MKSEKVLEKKAGCPHGRLLTDRHQRRTACPDCVHSENCPMYRADYIIRKMMEK